jgi:aminopeptidase N
MILISRRKSTLSRRCAGRMGLVAILLVLLAAPFVRGDEPYARSRDYDLQHSRIALRFDLEHKKVLGDVTHTLSILVDGTSRISFDSVGLTIESVSINKAPAKFETTAEQLNVRLPAAAKAGEKFNIEIRYQGRPSKGLYFILPDKDYPDRPSQIWTQGESEDTRYYLPTYDYPNDRLTTETILTVPASWITVANGKLISVSDASNGLKTWTWKESVPSSTYLITVVAGEFDEVKDSWRGIPVAYYAPKGRGDRLSIDYGHTSAMMELFSKKLGIDYPWEKYSQAMVDEFVAGGMENSSATTNNSSSLTHVKLAPEYLTGEDDLISHELGHQWFGDLVTCKDWGNVWLNEGFATYLESVWAEAHYGKDLADLGRWNNGREWFQESHLYKLPIVRHDFDDASEFDDNAYNKGGWVLHMLRHQLGDDAFYRGLHHYLEANRGKNVVTADLAKAIEEATHVNIDEFFGQWVYGAGAPLFDLSYAYDADKHQVALTVKQTQKREGRVGLFRIITDVEITTASGPKLFPITVSEAAKTYVFPATSEPLMVLFDKGGHILKSAEFHKEKKEWLYQLKHAGEIADRADAVVALGKIKHDDEVVSALGEALRMDKQWGIRAIAADTLGQNGGPAASKLLLEALNSSSEPWLRSRIISALGNFHDDPAIAAKLESIAREDSSYRARTSALQGIARLKSPNALSTLSRAVASDSPDGIARNAALRAFGSLGDDKAVPLLLEWAALGKPIESRTAAINSLGRLQKDNKDITKQIAAFLSEPHFPVRMASIYALGARGDSTAIPALESLLHSDDLSIEMVPLIKGQITRLKNPQGKGTHSRFHEDDEESSGGASANVEPGTGTEGSEVTQRLDKLERLMQQVEERLKAIEGRLPPPTPKP